MALGHKKAAPKARSTRPQKNPVASFYRFRYHAEGIELEFEGDKEFVISLIQSYAPPKSSNTASPLIDNSEFNVPKTSNKIDKSDKLLSVREFILQFGLKKHTDRVLAFGFFLEKNMGQESFTPADINSLYYDSKMEASNTSQMLIQNIKRGFVMEAKSTGSAKKRYTLTNSGETYLAGLMNSPNS